MLLPRLMSRFFIEILHRDLRNCFFFRHLSFAFHILFGLLFSLFDLNFFSYFYLDFYFFFRLLFFLFPFLHKSRSDLGFLPSIFLLTYVILVRFPPGKSISPPPSPTILCKCCFFSFQNCKSFTSTKLGAERSQYVKIPLLPNPM